MLWPPMMLRVFAPALRFADLVNHRLSDYVFNLERLAPAETLVSDLARRGASVTLVLLMSSARYFPKVL